MIRKYVESLAGVVAAPPGLLNVELSQAGSVLSALADGGVAPYHYIFSCIATGPCTNYSISNPDQTSSGMVNTGFLATAYGGASYTFRVDVTDSSGHTAFNEITISPCLVPETLILMRDGNNMMLRDVRIGDLLFDSKVVSQQEHQVDKIYVIDTTIAQLKTSRNHVNILKNGDLVVSSMLEEGMELVDKDFKPTKIIGIKIIEEITKVINISTDTENYIANGIRTHNKLPC